MYVLRSSKTRCSQFINLPVERWDMYHFNADPVNKWTADSNNSLSDTRSAWDRAWTCSRNSFSFRPWSSPLYLAMFHLETGKVCRVWYGTVYWFWGYGLEKEGWYCWSGTGCCTVGVCNDGCCDREPITGLLIFWLWEKTGKVVFIGGLLGTLLNRWPMESVTWDCLCWLTDGRWFWGWGMFQG